MHLKAKAMSLTVAVALLGCGSTVSIFDSAGGGDAPTDGRSSTRATAGNGGAGTGTSGSAGGAEPMPVMGSTFTVGPGYLDAVLDAERGQVFLSYGKDAVVRVVSLKDGTITSVNTGYRAEFMFFDAERDQVIVTVAVKDHSLYWFDNQEGYVAAIDAVAPVDPNLIWIPIDPWQVVSDGAGHAFVGGGSGQSTEMASIDLMAGAYEITDSGYLYNNTSLGIHPGRDRVYGVTNGLSPGDIQRYDVTAGKVEYAYDSPYHGDYPMCGDLRIHPSGNSIFTKCGNVFRATNTKGSDMTHIGSLSQGWDDLVFHPAGNVAYALRGEEPTTLFAYDIETLTLTHTYSLAGPAERLLAGPDYLVLIRTGGGGNPVTVVEVIPYLSLL